jgi:subfamily B ATP-binding cassette protein MsbA
MNRSALASLFALARPYPWVVPTLAALGILASLAEGLGIGLLIPVLGEVIGGPSMPSGAGPLAVYLQTITDRIDTEHRLGLLALLIVGLVALKTIVTITHTAVSHWVNGRVAHDQRTRLADRLLHAEYAFVSRLERGRLVNLLESQADRAGETMTMVAGLLGAACTILVFLLLLAMLSWRLTLVVGAVVVPVSVFVWAMTRWSRRLGRRLVQAYSTLTTRCLEIVGSLRTLRLFGAEEAESARLDAASDAVRRASLRTWITVGAIHPVVEFLYVPVFIAVLAYALRAGIGLPILFAFLALLYRLQTPLKQINQQRVELSAAMASVDELGGLLQEAEGRPQASGQRPCPEGWQSIVFRDVSFTYEGKSAPAVDRVSLQIRRGEVVAVVGASGAGKSTLVNLLCRLYDPNDGQILVDGVPLTEFDTRSWRRGIAFAGQDADLLDGTVRQNVTLGFPEAPEGRIQEALQMANAAAFVSELPQGLETGLGPGGRQLSGGQRQRIALARALVLHPELLILDEATNAVDNVTEAEILAAIDALAGKCTIVVIAHRLATLRRASQAVVMEAGRVEECGSPEALLARGGLLAKQYDLE